MAYPNQLLRLYTGLYFSGARDRLQHNHNHEFSNTLLNQLFQEQQPSNFQGNTIFPPP
jgi:hypothetical protein